MEDEEEEAELFVDDMEMMGEDDLLFMSSEEGAGGSPTGDIAALFDGDGCFDAPLFPLLSLPSKGESSNTTATTGEASSGS